MDHILLHSSCYTCVPSPPASAGAMSDEEVNETLGSLKIPSKLLEMSSGHFKDRSKRRLSLPIAGRDVRR